MVGTVEDFVARKRQDADGLSDFDKMIVGPAWVRLEMPCHSTAAMKAWADMVRGLLSEIDFYCQPRLPGTTPADERSRCFHLRAVASQINARIRDKKPPGRPKKFQD